MIYKIWKNKKEVISLQKESIYHPLAYQNSSKKMINVNDN